MIMGFFFSTCSSIKSFLYHRLKNAQQAPPSAPCSNNVVCSMVHIIWQMTKLCAFLHPGHACFPCPCHNIYGLVETLKTENTQIKKLKFTQVIEKTDWE
jgi:hypothetical protein